MLTALQGTSCSRLQASPVHVISAAPLLHRPFPRVQPQPCPTPRAVLLKSEQLVAPEGGAEIQTLGSVQQDSLSHPVRDSKPQGNIVPLPPLLTSSRSSRSPDRLGWTDLDIEHHYSLGPELGRGSYGRVFLATSLIGDEAPVAVKVMPKHSARRTVEQQVRCIQREAKHWGQCQNSAYVSRLLGLYEDKDNAYFVQELCSGGDLKALLKDGPVTELEAAHIMRAVLDVLYECHSHYITYGDVKPANFMLKHKYLRPSQQQPAQSPSHSNSSSGHQSKAALCGHSAASSVAAGGPNMLVVRAIDFGCSLDTRGGQTRSSYVGTPLYLAPEGWNASTCSSCPVDVWAAGVMLYEMLTGMYPFWDCPSGQVELGNPTSFPIMMAINNNPIVMGPAWQRISKPGRDLILAMLDRNPGTRITCTDAFQHRWFRHVLGYNPVPSSRISDSDKSPL